jgi:hypothetical protein
MLSTKNRNYGLVIGGAISNAMGSVASYAPDLEVNDPYDANMVNIKPGYWTEPTGLVIARLQHSSTPATDLVPASCTGHTTKIDYPIISRMVQASVFCLESRDYVEQMDKATKLLNVKDRIGNDAIRLWIAIIDAVLHGLSKRALFNPAIYSAFNLAPEVQCILIVVSNKPLPLELELFREVLHVFKNTDGFVEGLKVIVNQSMFPAWTSTLYGQLAGAYYGITDIPENWMDVVQDSDKILASLKSISNVTL